MRHFFELVKILLSDELLSKVLLSTMFLLENQLY